MTAGRRAARAQRAVARHLRHVALAALAARSRGRRGGPATRPRPRWVALLVLAGLRLPRAALLAGGAGAGGRRRRATPGWRPSTRPGRGCDPGQRVAGPRTPAHPAAARAVRLQRRGARWPAAARRGARLLLRLGRGRRLAARRGAGRRGALSGYLRRPPPARGAGFDVRAYQRRRGHRRRGAGHRGPRSPAAGAGGRPGRSTGRGSAPGGRSPTGCSPPAAALAEGMVLGQDERIDQAVRDEFRASGLAHVLAVSGQNVMLLAALALPLLAAAGRGPPGAPGRGHRADRALRAAGRAPGRRCSGPG